MLAKLKAVLAGGAGEKGQALILVLMFLFAGAVVIPPLLNLTVTGLNTGLVYEKKTAELYAADAGVEDATWQIKYDHVYTLFSSPPYNPYNYTGAWDYSLPEQVNSQDVNISIANVWVPSDISVPSEAAATAIIEAEKLMVTGGAAGTTYAIKITYEPGALEDLRVETLGIWLPRGFSYVAGSSNLEADPWADYYAVPDVQPHAGNQAILWTFASTSFDSFPGVDPEASPKVAEITFQYTSTQPGAKPAAVAWLTTSGVEDIPFSWDADVRVYKIDSRVGNTSIEAYMAKEETRRLRSAIAGDYVATGNSLMIDSSGDWAGVRDQLLASSDATVNSIPADAEVAAAFLYWSAWRNEGSKQTAFYDNSNDFGNWLSGSTWNINSGRFRSHYSSGGESTRYLTLKNSLDLSSYLPGTVMVSWDQSESGTLEEDDGLDFAFSADGGTTWGSNIQALRDDIGSSPTRFSYIIPSQYLTAGFKLRFYLQSFGGDSEYCYLDNITIAAMPPDDSIVFRIDGQQEPVSKVGNYGRIRPTSGGARCHYGR